MDTNLYNIPLEKVKEGMRVYITSQDMNLIACIVESVFTNDDGYTVINFISEDTGERIVRMYYGYSDIYTPHIVD